jgi:hypothetical protein
LGMSTGALEGHYVLDDTEDSVLTPDFRILLTGPGEFHYAISADSHGNTCVRGLQGNTSVATVVELMGNRSYHVKPGEQAMFHLGQIDKVDGDVPPDCGCPPPPQVLKTSNPETPPHPETELPASATLTQDSGKPQAETHALTANSGPNILSSGPETTPVPSSQPNDIHVQVDAPLVFSGQQRAPAIASVSAPPQMLNVPVGERPASPARLYTSIEPPPAVASPTPPKPPHHRFLHRLKGIFTTLLG